MWQDNTEEKSELFLQTYNIIKEEIWWHYEKAGLKNKKPLIFIANSYLEEKLMINFIILLFNRIWTNSRVTPVNTRIWDQVRHEIWNQISNQVLEQVLDHAKNQLTIQVKTRFWTQISNQLRDQVLDQIGDQIGNQVLEQVLNQIRTQIWDKNLDFVEQGFRFGPDYWISFNKFLKKTHRFENQFEIYLQPYLDDIIGSIQFFENFVITCRHPKKVNRDASNRLHSTTEAAVQWFEKDECMELSDLYFIHGVYFKKDEWIKIVKNEISATDLLKMENKEKQRAALSVYSLEKLIQELDAKVIDIYKNKRDGNNEITLYQIKKEKVDLDENLHYLKYKDSSTDRVYISGVPPNIKKANKAMAWKFGLTVHEYKNNIVKET